MKNLSEAILHCKKKAKELSNKAYRECGKTMTEEQAYECNECAREHEQLARWLEELTELRKITTWIPIEYRPGTEEEYAEFSKFGTCHRSEFKVYTNEMPEDGQDVLITTKWGTVCEDIYHDEVDASYFEDHDDPDDVIAWMPKPKGYVPEDKR